MRYFFILIVFLTSCKENNKLEEKEQTLDLSYIAWACACPNWITREDLKKYSTDSLEKHCIYIEPSDSSLALPDSLPVGGTTVIRFTGHFYEQEGVPADFGYEEQRPSKARILRYTRYEVISVDSSGFYTGKDTPVISAHYSDKDTLVITGRAAAFYAPDSATIAKRMSDPNFRIGFDDAAGGMQEARQYLESVRLPVAATKNKHYLKFINAGGKSLLVKTDTLPDMAGIYLFDPSKPPRLVDMFDIEKEYADYYKQ